MKLNDGGRLQMGKNIQRIELGQENSCERLSHSFAFFLGG